MQKLLYGTSMFELSDEVNRLLKSGEWFVVENSVGCGSTQRAAQKYNEFASHTPDGVVHEQYFWAVLEEYEAWTQEEIDESEQEAQRLHEELFNKAGSTGVGTSIGS